MNRVEIVVRERDGVFVSDEWSQCFFSSHHSEYERESELVLLPKVLRDLSFVCILFEESISVYEPMQVKPFILLFTCVLRSPVLVNVDVRKSNRLIVELFWRFIDELSACHDSCSCSLISALRVGCLDGFLRGLSYFFLCLEFRDFNVVHFLHGFGDISWVLNVDSPTRRHHLVQRRRILRSIFQHPNLKWPLRSCCKKHVVYFSKHLRQIVFW